MPEFNLVTVITSTAQTVTAIVMAVLLLGFLRQYKKDYLRHWTLSWTALAAYYVTTSIGIALGVGYNVASSHPVRILTAILSGVFGYTNIAWLLFGIFELLRRRPVRRHDLPRLHRIPAASGHRNVDDRVSARRRARGVRAGHGRDGASRISRCAHRIAEPAAVHGPPDHVRRTGEPLEPEARRVLPRSRSFQGHQRLARPLDW